MYLLKTYIKEDNEELYDKCQELVVKYEYLFNDSRKSSCLKIKVTESVFQILSNLIARHRNKSYNYILIPQSKSFYSSSKNLNKSFITFTSTQIAQNILVKENIISLNKSTGYTASSVDEEGLLNINKNNTCSTATLNIEKLITPTADFIENLKKYSIFFYNFKKLETVLNKSNALTRYIKKQRRNKKHTAKKNEIKRDQAAKQRQIEIEKLQKEIDGIERTVLYLSPEQKVSLKKTINKSIIAKNKQLDKLKKQQTEYWTYKSPEAKAERLFNLEQKFGCKFFHEKKIEIESDPRLHAYNKFLSANGLSKYKMQRIFGNSIDEYGRCFGNIQQIPKSLRQKFYGENYTEIDFKSFGANCAYLLETGEKYKSKTNDLYIDMVYNLLKKCKIIDEDLSLKIDPDATDREIEDIQKYFNNIEKSYRDYFKYCTNLILSSKSESEGKKAIKQYLFENNLYFYNCYGEDVQRTIEEWRSLLHGILISRKKEHIMNIKKDGSNVIGLSENDVVDIIIGTAPVLKKYLYSNFSVTSQNIESETALDVFNYCVKNKILVLSVHDAFIVPIDKTDEIKAVMELYLIDNIKKYKIKRALKLKRSYTLPKIYELFNQEYDLKVTTDIIPIYKLYIFNHRLLLDF